MASEYPSDDIEAFAHSGQRVFAPEAVERLRRGVADAPLRGEVNEEGVFIADSCGALEVWRQPDGDPEWRWTNRYVAVVDVGGRSERADWSVVAVIDRLGDRPEVVAQWRGHTDHDLLAANAARIARWYDNALLVIESNTLETHDPDREVDGDQAPFLLRELQNTYPNLYKRRGSGAGPKPGFHTNVRTKPMVVGALVKAVREGLYVERDCRAVDELIQYERKPNGSYGASIGCHDDILMTRAIGIYIHEHEMEAPRRVLRRTPRSRSASRNEAQAFGF